MRRHTQQYDSQCVGGELLNIANGALYAAGQAAPTQKLCGFTGDSGVRDQLKNVLAAQINIPTDTDVDEKDVRDIRVRWKINGTGLYSPLVARPQ